MKRIKVISLDDDIYEKLKNVDNASKLVNNLLSEYFRKMSYENMSIEELDKIISVTEQKNVIEERKKSLEKEMKDLDNKINQLNEQNVVR